MNNRQVIQLNFVSSRRAFKRLCWSEPSDHKLFAIVRKLNFWHLRTLKQEPRKNWTQKRLASHRFFIYDSKFSLLWNLTVSCAGSKFDHAIHKSLLLCWCISKTRNGKPNHKKFVASVPLENFTNNAPNRRASKGWVLITKTKWKKKFYELANTEKKREWIFFTSATLSRFKSICDFYFFTETFSANIFVHH